MLGILAHVDAGKTTLSEALLYLCGAIRTRGRVDHGNTHLDTNAMERERGITVFSKQARLSYRETDLVLLDTPGHTDLAAEAERCLQVLDYAVLVIGGESGIRNHTLTLWKLLRSYHIPTFLFINKMDLPTRSPEELMQMLSQRIHPDCVPLFPKEEASTRAERFAMLSEELMEHYLATGELTDSSIAELVAQERCFPCLFGSALRMEGVEELLEALNRYTLPREYPAEFGASVYKILRDGIGTPNERRLSCIKLTGGSLSVRDEISYQRADGSRCREKAAQLLLISGEKHTQVNRVEAGDICAVAGLSSTYAGGALGAELPAPQPVLEPVLTYRLGFADGYDAKEIYPKLQKLEEEEPSFRLSHREECGEIYVRLMGEVQTDLFKRFLRDRLGLEITLDAGSILYRETVASSVIGVGHFEPLRHYAEVHVLIEPLSPESGIIVDSECPTSALERGAQAQILEILSTETHRGVLTGSPLTDVRLVLLAGRTHPKHTEGGDLRQATLRAVRQGLMQAESLLLEPFYRYRIEFPATDAGRVLNDLQAHSTDLSTTVQENGMTTVTGRAPVARLQNYAQTLRTYTRGQGELFCSFDGYSPCAMQKEIVQAIGYEPERDLAHPTGSVFCQKGAGYAVPWDRVPELMHINSGYRLQTGRREVLPSIRTVATEHHISEKELAGILQRIFGERKKTAERSFRVNGRSVQAPKQPRLQKPQPPRKQLLIVDGYNVIFSWESLKSAAAVSLEGAREDLMVLLANYVGYTGCELILIFDGYRNPESRGEDMIRDKLRVIYTPAGETADARMERLMHELGPGYHIRAVTSDALIQISALRSGVLRMTSKEFEAEVYRIRAEITDLLQKML